MGVCGANKVSIMKQIQEQKKRNVKPNHLISSTTKICPIFISISAFILTSYIKRLTCVHWCCYQTKLGKWCLTLSKIFSLCSCPWWMLYTPLHNLRKSKEYKHLNVCSRFDKSCQNCTTQAPIHTSFQWLKVDLSLEPQLLSVCLPMYGHSEYLLMSWLVCYSQTSPWSSLNVTEGELW